MKFLHVEVETQPPGRSSNNELGKAYSRSLRLYVYTCVSKIVSARLLNNIAHISKDHIPNNTYFQEYIDVYFSTWAQFLPAATLLIMLEGMRSLWWEKILELVGSDQMKKELVWFQLCITSLSFTSGWQINELKMRCIWWTDLCFVWKLKHNWNESFLHEYWFPFAFRRFVDKFSRRRLQISVWRKISAHSTHENNRPSLVKTICILLWYAGKQEFFL